MDLIGHLTGIIGQMVRPETIIEPLERVEASYDRWADIYGRAFRGVGPIDKKEYVFDESLFRWETGQALTDHVTLLNAFQGSSSMFYLENGGNDRIIGNSHDNFRWTPTSREKSSLTGSVAPVDATASLSLVRPTVSFSPTSVNITRTGVAE